MRILRLLLVGTMMSVALVAGVSMPIVASGCESMQDAGEEVGDAAEDVGEAAGDVVEEAGDVAEEAGDEVTDTMD